MKEGWEYKKLGEVCDRVSNIKWQNVPSDAVYSYVDLTAVDRDSLNITETQSINNENAPSRAKQIIKENDVLFGTTRPTLKRFCIVEDKNDGNICSTGFCVLRPNNKIVSSKWVFYQLMADKFYAYIEPLQSGAAYPAVTDGIVKSYIIPIPSLSEQQHIVEELDLLSSIIEKKKAQLKELDNLAQSLFYEMFGDPITNDKGWEVKKIGEIAESKIGVTYKPTDVNDNGIIVLRSSNIQNSEIDLEDIVRVNCIIKDEKYVRDGDILMCTRNGSFRLVGKVALINNLPERMTYGAFMTIIRSQYNDFLFMFFQLPAFRQQLATAQTATINQITVKMLNDVKVIVPPLDLQNQFASKIEAIEHQKELIKQSIKEVEMLFNSRMDHYFN